MANGEQDRAIPFSDSPVSIVQSIKLFINGCEVGARII